MMVKTLCLKHMYNRVYKNLTASTKVVSFILQEQGAREDLIQDLKYEEGYGG